jgi:hypothetical protein
MNIIVFKSQCRRNVEAATAVTNPYWACRPTLRSPQSTYRSLSPREPSDIPGRGRATNLPRLADCVNLPHRVAADGMGPMALGAPRSHVRDADV